MKRLINMLPGIAILTLSAITIAAAGTFVDIDNGNSNTFDDDTYRSSFVRLDYDTATDPGTQLNLVNGALVSTIAAYNKSVINMSGGFVRAVLSSFDSAAITITGGSVDMYILSRDTSTITLSGGSVVQSVRAEGSSIISMTGGSTDGTLVAGDNATVNFSGGLVGSLFSRNDATVNMTGGTIDGHLRADVNGIIYLYGSNFEVIDLDGKTTSLSNGDKLSKFGTLVEDGIYDYFTGTINGTLANGSTLDNEFKIFNTEFYAGTADIVTVIPCDFILVGDLDDNCKVDLADLAIMATNWLIDCHVNPTDPACISKTE